MCGITGVFAFNEIGRFSMIKTARSNETLQRRGPDASRLWNDEYINFGHSRLSVLDTSAKGLQPMRDEHEKFVIVFNGEIYNYPELRRELEQKGHSFRSDTDTEVLLRLYMREGENCLNKLNGCFAFAIYDTENAEIFLARDRFGIKPLYYSEDEDKFVFASEMQALLEYGLPRVLDYESLYTYFQLNYIPHSHTIFKGIRKLPPGHKMKVKKRDIKVERFYELKAEPKLYSSLTYEAAQKELLKLLETAVKDRLAADVPLGAFLSGGIDSSAVAAMASRHTSKLQTFSIGYSDNAFFDETKYAREAAKKFGTDHHVFNLNQEDIFREIEGALNYLSEPFADSSAVPMYALSRRTSEHLKVALSGDGGDELFAGYQKYRGEFKVRKGGLLASLVKGNKGLLSKMPQSRNSKTGMFFRRLNRFAEAAELSPQERYRYLSSVSPESFVRGFMSKDSLGRTDTDAARERLNSFSKEVGSNDFNEFLLADIRMVLAGDMLPKVDLMSMANGLEVRVPFLDHGLVEFAFRLPAEYKLNDKMLKRILQDAVRPLLPPSLYNRPKKGFEVPLQNAYTGFLRDKIENEWLNDDFVQEQGIFNPSAVSELRKRIFSGEDYDQNQVWSVLAFQHWWKRFEPLKEAPENDY